MASYLSAAGRRGAAPRVKGLSFLALRCFPLRVRGAKYAGMYARHVGEKHRLKGGNARGGGLPLRRTVFPQPYDEVWVAGRTRTYRVILIDYYAKTVDLMGVGRASSTLSGIPFSELRPVEQDGAGPEKTPPA
jgi:hypothetical protein